MRSRILLPLFLLLLGAPAVAGEKDDLYRALDLERASGKYVEALALYRTAAGAEDAGVAAEARLGAVRCLRLLERGDEAREELSALLAGDLSPDLRAAAEAERVRISGPEGAEEEAIRELRAELAKLRGERDRLRIELDTEEGSREELQRELKEKESALAELGRRLDDLTRRGGEAAGGKDLERERQLAKREELAAWALGQARASYGEGRFEEALDWANKALWFDPASPEARELKHRLGDAPGTRDHLVREVLRVLDLVRTLRLDELRTEIDARLAAGEDLLLRGRLDEAVARCREAIAIAGAGPATNEDLAIRRQKAEELLARAVVRGGRPGAVPLSLPEIAEADDAAAEIREHLARLASSERPGGSQLRVYPLPAEAAEEGEELPSGTFGRTARRPPSAPLLRDLLPVLVHPPAWRDASNFVREAGRALVVYAPAEVQDGVRELLTRIAARQDPSVRIGLTLFSADADALAEAAARAGARFSTRGDTAFAVASSVEAETLRAELLDGEGGKILGRLVLPVDPGVPVEVALSRSVNLLAPRAEPDEPELRRLDYGFTASLLPVRAGDDLGIAVALAATGLRKTLTLPGAGGTDLQVPALDTATGEAVVRMAPGRSLVVTGLADPFAFGRGRVLVLTLDIEGEAGPSTTEPPAEAGAGGPVPIDLSGLDAEPPDEPAPPFEGERSRAEESRTGFLLRHLWETVGGDLSDPGASLTLNRGVVWVRGDDRLVSRVREAVEGLLGTRDRLVRVGIRAAAISAAEETRLLSGLPDGGRVVTGEGIRTFVLDPTQLTRGGLIWYLAGTPGRVPLPETVVARPTQLVSLVRAARTPYLSGYRTGKDGETWPRYETVDEGIAAEIRPLLLPGDRIDLALGVRIARILPRAPEEPPVQTISVARVRAVLTKGQGLLVSGLPAPTPVVDRRDRLVLLLTAEE